jgi:hypothetical protein
MARAPVVNLNLRLPPDLHEQIVALAAQDQRSLNSEIVRLLSKAVAREQVSPVSLEERQAALEAAVRAIEESLPPGITIAKLGSKK